MISSSLPLLSKVSSFLKYHRFGYLVDPSSLLGGDFEAGERDYRQTVDRKRTRLNWA
jgi:hypothetical protein